MLIVTRQFLCCSSLFVCWLLQKCCFVVIVCSSFLLFVPREGCGSCTWSFPSNSIYISKPRLQSLVRSYPSSQSLDLVAFRGDWILGITETRLYSFDPLKPRFYTEKMGFTGYTVIFFSAKNIDCGYSLESPRRGGSNLYQHYMFWAEIWKLPKFFIWKLSFLVVKFSMYVRIWIGVFS